MELLERLSAPGPKRILALDGGGIRGAMTVGFLERIEEILRDRHGDPNLRLCDYFDLIGGTSTGAIIASGLAIGMNASDIKQMYIELGGKVFGRKSWKKWKSIFASGPLQDELERVFGDMTLGDPGIETGLCVVTKRADTGSTWPLYNHPGGTFYLQNKDMLLRQVVRASAAAPVFFVPELVDVGLGEMAAFVDGGVSMANNPALQLFLLAVLKGYPFRWRTGEDNLMVVSVGTGTWPRRDRPEVVVNGKLWDSALQVPSMLMDDASWQNQLLLQDLSRTKTAWHIDSEVGDLDDDQITAEPVLTYLRYNVRLVPEGLAELGLEHLAPKVGQLREMSAAASRFDLATVGEAAAARQVSPDHFPPAFDLTSGLPGSAAASSTEAA